MVLEVLKVGSSLSFRGLYSKWCVFSPKLKDLEWKRLLKPKEQLASWVTSCFSKGSGGLSGRTVVIFTQKPSPPLAFPWAPLSSLLLFVCWRGMYAAESGCTWVWLQRTWNTKMVGRSALWSLKCCGRRGSKQAMNSVLASSLCQKVESGQIVSNYLASTWTNSQRVMAVPSSAPEVLVGVVLAIFPQWVMSEERFRAGWCIRAVLRLLLVHIRTALNWAKKF